MGMALGDFIAAGAFALTIILAILAQMRRNRTKTFKEHEKVDAKIELLRNSVSNVNTAVSEQIRDMETTISRNYVRRDEFLEVKEDIRQIRDWLIPHGSRSDRRG